MKKLFFHLLFSCSSLLTFSQVNEKILLNEEFNDNKNDWYLFNNINAGKGSCEMSNGSLYMENKDKMIRTSSIWVTIDTSYDFKIITSAKCISGDQNYGYGIYFGASDIKNCYCFVISGGHFMLFKYENGQDQTLMQWTKSPAILQGYNTGNILMLSKEKDDWKFYSNGQFVTSYKAQPFYGGKIGVAVEGPQRVEFGHLYVKNIYPLAGGSGTLCEMIPVIRAQAKTKFNSIATNEFIKTDSKTTRGERSERRTINTDGKMEVPKYKSTITVTDALLNYIDGGRSNYYVSRLGVYNTSEEAIKKMDSVRSQLSTCLKSYAVTKSSTLSNGLPYYKIDEKFYGGFIIEGNTLGIRKDSLANQFIVEVVISNWKGIARNYIENKSDNSKLAAQLNQLIQHSTDQFSKIRGASIPGTNRDTLYYKQYNTSFRLEGAQKNYVDLSYSTYSHISVYGDNINEKDAETLFNNLFEKLKKALGSEFIYSVKNEQSTYWLKEVSYISKTNDSDKRGVILRRTALPGSKDLYKVEIVAKNDWSVGY